MHTDFGGAQSFRFQVDKIDEVWRRAESKPILTNLSTIETRMKNALAQIHTHTYALENM